MARGLWKQQEGDLWVAEWASSSVRTHRPAPGHVVVLRCDIAEHDDPSKVVRDILRFASQDGGRITTWETPDRQRINRALLAAGATVHRRKLFVQRELTGEDLPEPGRFEWQTLAESDDDAFLEVLWEASQGDPFEGPDRDAKREWAELVEGTGEALDPTLWRIALQGGEPVGVVLPTVWKGERRAGTLSYIGVLPAHRGRGLGCALHAAGLHLLREAGALRYVGSTDERNTAMARVMERNGCGTPSLQLLLRTPR